MELGGVIWRLSACRLRVVANEKESDDLCAFIAHCFSSQSATSTEFKTEP
jgi:hypothetical protein